MFASMFGRTEVVLLLQKYGANVRAKNKYGLRAKGMGRLAPLLGRLFGTQSSSE
jgi:hypothetical protein